MGRPTVTKEVVRFSMENITNQTDSDKVQWVRGVTENESAFKD